MQQTHPRLGRTAGSFRPSLLLRYAVVYSLGSLSMVWGHYVMRKSRTRWSQAWKMGFQGLSKGWTKLLPGVQGEEEPVCWVLRLHGPWISGP